MSSPSALLCLALPAYAEDSDFQIDENGVLTKYLGSGGDVVIPDGVSAIGVSAFRGCSSLESVTIPDSVKDIGDFAFKGCSSLGSVTIPDSVTAIGDQAFAFCDSLTSASIGNGVQLLGNRFRTTGQPRGLVCLHIAAA